MAVVECRRLRFHVAQADVVIGEYLARTRFIEELDDVARRHGAPLAEILLSLTAQQLTVRLAGRAQQPTRAERTIQQQAGARRGRPEAAGIPAPGHQ